MVVAKQQKPKPATDPVAVVALLRTLGAPRRLALLLEGESLFNGAEDGDFVLTGPVAADGSAAGFDDLTGSFGDRCAGRSSG